MNKKGSQLRCPLCSSEEVIRHKHFGKTFVFSFLLLGFPIPYIPKRYYCFDCKKDFKRT